jgi:hypothetical protein
MQKEEFNRAASRVANRTDRSGRATAEQTNLVLRFRKENSLRCIARSTLIGSLVLAALFSIPASIPAHADEDHDHDIDRRREDNDKGVRAEIKALREQVASLGSTVSGLQSQVTALQTANTVLETRLAAVQSNPALKLGPFVSVDSNTEIGVNGPNITFTGANIHIVSGSGATGDYGNGKALGLGNLIIGYDEDPINYPTGGPGGGFKPLSPGDRAGSHNLVIGSGHRFSSSSGLVAGELNSLGGFGSSITGGYANTTGGPFSSVSGGEFNLATAEGASVSGGGANIADGTDASVSGGLDNHADANSSSITGGAFNIASGQWASISGGQNNTASGSTTTVTGGVGNSAVGFNTVVIGGQNIIDNNNNSIAPKPPFP